MHAGAGWSHRPGANPFCRVERISPRIWLVVEDDRFNEHPFLYVIIGTLRIVLVDTGVGSGGKAAYREWLQRKLLPSCLEDESALDLPIFVINTHVHFDHVGGNAGLASVAEAIAASGHDPGFTTAALDPSRDASLARAVGCIELAPYEVSHWLADGERVPLGDSDDDCLHVVHTPGHTPDSLCLWLAKERILFCGDTIYPHAAVILSNRDSSVSDYRQSIAKLQRLVAEAASPNPNPNLNPSPNPSPSPSPKQLLAEVAAAVGAAASRQTATGSSSDGDARRPITLACGHIASDAAAAYSLEVVAKLVADVASGTAEQSRPAHAGAVAFARAEFEVLLRHDQVADMVNDRQRMGERTGTDFQALSGED